MSAYFTHDLETNREEVIAFSLTPSLSIVDVESYRTFVNPKADNLDLMVHLHDQLNALTAFTWDVPDRPLNLRLVVTDDHRAMERLTFANRPPSASGTVRTHGSLCLLSHDRLIDCARHRTHDLLKGGRLPTGGRPHVLKVPSGIFYILVYYRFPDPPGSHPGYLSASDGASDYTVYLHHYPHPAPRVAPVRLTRGLIPWAGETASAQPWGTRTTSPGSSAIQDHSGKPLAEI